jgi:hypothetical protein
VRPEGAAISRIFLFGRATGWSFAGKGPVWLGIASQEAQWAFSKKAQGKNRLRFSSPQKKLF